MFKPGDKAWHPQYGDGFTYQTQLNLRPIYFKNDSGETRPLLPDGRENESDLNPVIFHKEQKFDLSEPEPEIGTWGYFVDDESTTEDSPACWLDILRGIHEGKYYCSDGVPFDRFVPYPSLPQHIKDMMEGKG